MFLQIKEEQISLNFSGRDTSRPFQDSLPLVFSTPPTSAKVKIIWNESSKQWRIFYSINGGEPTAELPQSKEGLYSGVPLSESTAAYIMMSNGSMEVAHYEITPCYR